MKDMSYRRIYESREYLSTLGTIRHRALFGGYSLAVDDTVFAMVAKGELYLRACEKSAEYCAQHPAPLLTIMKRGRPVLLNYYRVDESLWQDRETLMKLSAWSLTAAWKEKMQRLCKPRLKDMPNLNFQLEMLLWEAGVPDVATLKKLGAKACWLRLRTINTHLGVNVLMALAGAIEGMHQAALPLQLRQALKTWYTEFEAESCQPQRIT